MGLDMFLSRKKYVGAKYEHRKVTGDIKILVDGKELPINFNKVDYIEEEGLYWRKANAIHKWFVDNVQKGVDDCRDYYVNKSQLEELLKICKELMEKVEIGEKEVKVNQFVDGEMKEVTEKVRAVKNPKVCEELLPTQAGFFFGGTNYDEWYLQDIEYTIKGLEELLEDENKLNEEHIYSDFYYHSSW